MDEWIQNKKMPCIKREEKEMKHKKEEEKKKREEKEEFQVSHVSLGNIFMRPIFFCLSLCSRRTPSLCSHTDAA